MKAQQIAINSISTIDAPVEEVCAAYAAAGFKNVEFPLSRLKAWLAKGKTPADLGKLFASHDLKFIGGFETVFAAFDQAKITANHEQNRANAKLVSDLGGGVMVVGTDGPVAPAVKNEEALKQLGKALRQFLPHVPANVSLAVEFNWSPLVKSLRSAAIVAEAADDKRVGILFDPAHYYCTPTKFDDLDAKTVAKILHVHVNDMNGRPGDLAHCNDDRVLPGQGVIDLRAIVGRLEKHGYRGYFSIELFNKEIWKLPIAQSAKMCYDSMKQLAGV